MSARDSALYAGELDVGSHGVRWAGRQVSVEAGRLMPVFSTICLMECPSSRRWAAQSSFVGSTALGRPRRLPLPTATTRAGGHAFDRVGAFHLPEEREHHHGELRHGIFRGWPGPLGRHALRLRLRPSALCRDLPLSSSSIGSGSKGCATVSSPVNGTVESKPSDSAALCSSWCWMVKCRRIQMVARARELVLHNGGGVQW